MWKCYLNDKTLHVAASIKALSSLSELPSTGHTHARTHTTLLKPFKSQYIENVFTDRNVSSNIQILQQDKTSSFIKTSQDLSPQQHFIFLTCIDLKGKAEENTLNKRNNNTSIFSLS